LFKKESRKFLTINREFIEAYSNIIDEKMILSVTKSKLIEHFNIEAIELFFLDDDNTYSEIDSGLKLPANSNLVNWLETNRTNLVIQSRVDEYVNQDLTLLKITNYDNIFPLINLNKLLAFAVIKFNNTTDADTIPFLESLFSLCVLSYDNAKRVNQERERHLNEKEKSNLSVIRKMVSILAHEIKNPLTSIRSSIQYISMNSSSRIISELSTDLVSEVDRISEITKQMLGRSNPQIGKLDSLDLIDLINYFIRINKNLLQSKDIALELNVTNEEQKHAVKGDESALIGILTNFVNNSIDALHGTEQAKIEIDLKFNDDSVLVAWIDNGCGIKRENMENIFEPFFSTKTTGYGLGLAYCKKLLKEMDSELEVTSNPGKGTRFFFSLNYNNE